MRGRIPMRPLVRFSNGPLRQKQQQLRSYAVAWNPFKRQAARVDDAEPKDAERIPEQLVDLRQKMRASNDCATLSAVLKSLQRLDHQNAQTFTTMNDVIKKLDSSSGAEVVDSRTLIPGMSPEECLVLFRCVVGNVSRENYQSARFIPRLYLQMMKHAEASSDASMMTELFELFTLYLITLGFEDQALKVVKGFMDQTVSKSRISKALGTVLSHDIDIHPSLIKGIITVIPDSKLVSSGVLATVNFLHNREHSLFAIDSNDQGAIRFLVDTVSSQPLGNDDSLIKNTLQICEIINGQFPEEEQKLLQAIQSEGITSEEVGLLVTKRSLANGCSPLEGQIWLKLMDQYPLLKLTWSVYLNGFQNVPDELINESTLNLLILATINSHEAQLPQLLEFFTESSVELTNESFEILFNKYISTSNHELLEKSFEDSLQHGIDWSDNPILYKFFVSMASSPEADVKKIFQLSKKIKIYVPYLDAESYNCLMKLILQNEFIQDAIVSFKEELPLLDGDAKYTQANYPSLYNTILHWCMNSATYPEDVHKLYTSFTEKFIIPMDFYFPLIKRLTELHRPDFAFQIFQDMKRIHRLTGSIPPPTPDVYIHLFKSFGHELYNDGVDTLDAIYKTDLNINTSIPLLNSILDAYTSLQNFNKVSQTYSKILGHPRGPDHETVSIMLKAHSLLSLDNVKDYWNNLDEIGILPNEDNYKRYIIAHCYHGDSDTALAIANEMSDMDVSVNADVVKTLYEWSDDKKKVEDWAIEEHSQTWKEVDEEVKALVAVESEEIADPGMTIKEMKLIRT